MTQRRNRRGHLVATVTLACSLIVLSPNAHAGDVLLFAAASTSDALNSLIGDYTETTGETVRTSYASSGALARQIDNGAPAALYLSANTDWIDWLEKRNKLTASSRTVLFKNRLVLIEPIRDPSGHARTLIYRNIPEQLQRIRGRLAIADPDHVPAGAYAKAALMSLGLWGKFSGTAARAKDVRGALLLVERREAMLGIVYRTDAKQSQRVNILDIFPENTHPPIQYSLAIVRENNAAAARRLYDFLNSRKARAYFVRYGFVSR